jgi:ClpX C4-type zinc finger protein
MTSIDELRADIACSFCLKPTKDVSSMVAGPGVFICDQCVSLCAEIIAAKPAEGSEVARWEQELSDEGLLDHLPRIAALSAQVERQLTAWVRHARERGVTWARIGAALDMTRQSAWERFSGEE